MGKVNKETRVMGQTCGYAGCQGLLKEWKRIEYVEREVVPTADGGDYVRFLIPFCSRLCLRRWLDVNADD